MRRLAVIALICGLPTSALAQNLRAIDVTPPAELVAGQPATFSITVAADAGTAPGAFTGQLLLVEGGRISTALPLATFGPETVAPGQQDVLMVTRPVPGAVEGVYEVAVRLDHANLIPETNELDNVAVAATPSRVRPPAADGAASTVTVAATEVAPGGSSTADVTVRNDGEATGSIVVSVVISRDDRITPTDPEIGRTTVNLAAGAQQTPSIPITIPADFAAGTYRVGAIVDPEATLREGDETNNVSIATERLNVVWDTLTFETASASAATLTVGYYLRFASTGGDGTYAYDLVGGALPDGLRIENEALLGIPVKTGRFDFEVRVQSNGLSDTQMFTVEVFETGAPVRIVTLDATPGFKDLEYEQLLVAGGGEGPYAWTLSNGLLPPGLDLTTAGVISGIPNQIGVFGFEVTVEDSLGERDTVELSIEIVFASQLLITSTRLGSVVMGEEADVALSAVGGVPPYEWKALTSLPPGMTLSEDGHLLGTPTHVGTYKTRVRVIDSTRDPSEDTSLVEIVVADDGNFEIVTKSLPEAYIRARYEVVIEAQGGTPPLAWRLAPGSQLPSGFFVEPGDGEFVPEGALRLYGVGFRELDQPFIIRVEDDSGRRREVPYVLSVRRGGSADSGGDGGCICVNRSDKSSWWVLLFFFAVLRIPRRPR